MSVGARALYDYTARSDKELTFKRGDTLKVIEKSADGHWWDGLCGSNRGFIPVAYVEITDLLAPSATVTNIPPPPMRRSSMQDRGDEEGGGTGRVSEAPVECSILEKPMAQVSCSPEPPKVTLTVEPEAGEELVEEGEERAPLSPTEGVKQEPPAQKATVPIASGSVKTLTSKFAPHPPQQQVLVQPRKHSDLSPRKSCELPPSSSDAEVINRSASASSPSGSSSSSGRVTQLSEQFKHRNPPPPTKPRPPSHVLSPGAERGASSFTITPHSSTTGSPLQQAQLGSQLTPKSSAPVAKGAPPKPRGSLVLRRDKSQKKEERPPLPSKPLTKPPPPKAPTELRAELQAVVGKRRPTD